MTETISTVWHRECVNLAECGVRMEVTLREETTDEPQAVPEPTTGPANCPLCGGEWGEWKPAAPNDELTACDMHEEHLNPLYLGDGDWRCEDCGAEWNDQDGDDES